MGKRGGPTLHAMIMREAASTGKRKAPLLTNAERRLLTQLTEEPMNVGAQWKASRVFLNLYDRDLVFMTLRSRSDISCGPGYHGSDWLIGRTEAGRRALAEDGGVDGVL